MNRRTQGQAYNITSMPYPQTSAAQYLAKGVHRVLTSLAAVFALVAVTVCVCVALGRGPVAQPDAGSQGGTVTITSQGDASTPDVPPLDAPLTPQSPAASAGQAQYASAEITSAQVHGTGSVQLASARSSRSRTSTRSTRTAANGTVTVVTRTTDRSGTAPNVTTHTHSVSRATTVAGAVTVTITDTYRTTS